MPTLILTTRFSADSQALWRAAVRRGWDVRRLSGWRVPGDLKSATEPVIYAEAIVAPVIAEQFGIELLDPPLDWLARLPEEYRKRDIRLSTLGEARKSLDPIFVKPPNDIIFPAHVYHGQALPAHLPEETPVLLAEIVEWEVEFRCFVQDRRMLTYSIYLRGGELQDESGYASSEEEIQQVLAFVSTLLADRRVEFLDATAMDVGIIAGRGWAVVEQNSPWGAGIYGCEPDAVLTILHRSSRKSNTREVDHASGV